MLLLLNLITGHISARHDRHRIIMPLRFVKSATYLLLLFGLSAVPASAQSLSCALPTNQIIMHCEEAACNAGFLVYHVPTGFPCETRPDVGDTEDIHVELVTQLIKLAALSTQSGVYELNFLNCTRDSISSIPWEQLAERETDWEHTLTQQADWQLSERGERLTLVGRDHGCTLSLLLAPLGEGEEVVKKLRRDYQRQQFWESSKAFIRLWLVPLLIIPGIVVLTGIWAKNIFHAAADKPIRFLWLVLPVLFQLALFLHVVEPAQNIWLGPYRFLFLLPSAGIFILWLLELMYLWKALAEWLDKNFKPEKDEETSATTDKFENHRKKRTAPHDS